MTEPESGPNGGLAPVPPVAAPARIATGRLALMVLATALLSAALSAAFTYVAVSVLPRTAVPVAQSAAPTAIAQTLSLTQSEAVVRVAAMARPAVVTITTEGVTKIGPYAMPYTGAGSGFIVSSDGLILTNYHVVMDSRTVTVALDGGRELSANVVATDRTSDLALVRVSATGLAVLELGDSDAAEVGQMAIAIGSPLGTFTDSVTQGIVSGLGRDITVGERGSGFTEDLKGLIQTDAAINPGNSGGPLLDVSGRVIGIVTATSTSAQDMGFAVPVNRAKAMIAAATTT